MVHYTSDIIERYMNGVVVRVSELDSSSPSVFFFFFFFFWGGGLDFHCHDCTCSFLKLAGLQVVKMYFAVLEIVNICSFTGSLYYAEVENKAIHLHLCLSIECL